VSRDLVRTSRDFEDVSRDLVRTSRDFEEVSRGLVRTSRDFEIGFSTGSPDTTYICISLSDSPIWNSVGTDSASLPINLIMVTI